MNNELYNISSLVKEAAEDDGYTRAEAAKRMGLGSIPTSIASSLLGAGIGAAVAHRMGIPTNSLGRMGAGVLGGAAAESLTNAGFGALLGKGAHGSKDMAKRFGAVGAGVGGLGGALSGAMLGKALGKGGLRYGLAGLGAGALLGGLGAAGHAALNNYVGGKMLDGYRATKTAADEGYSRSEAAKRMAIGGSLIGTALGAAGGGLGGALSGAAGGALSGGINGALFGKGVRNSKDMAKRYAMLSGGLGALSGTALGAVLGGRNGSVGGAVLGGLGGALGMGALGAAGGAVQGAGAHALGDAVLCEYRDHKALQKAQLEAAQAKTAAEILYNDTINDASEKLAFAQDLYDEACEAEKYAADEGYSRSEAAKRMAIGGSLIGTALGAARGGLGGALSGAAGGALGGGIDGALFGKGVRNSKGMAKRYAMLGGGLGALSGGLAGAAAGAAYGGRNGSVGGAVLGGLGGALGIGALGAAGGAVHGAAAHALGDAVLSDYRDHKALQKAQAEAAQAKTAAEILYNDTINDANEKIAFAQALYDEACEAEKTAGLIINVDRVGAQLAGLGAKAKNLISNNPKKVVGALSAAGLGAYGAHKYLNRKADVEPEEVEEAKTAAEILYNDTINDANEKIAFAQALYEEADKYAADNGSATPVVYPDQVTTPAGAEQVGIVPGGAVQDLAAGMQTPDTVGEASVSNVGALTAFVNQKRKERAEQAAAEVATSNNC